MKGLSIQNTGFLGSLGVETISFFDTFTSDKGWTHANAQTSLDTGNGEIDYTEASSTYCRALKDLQDADALGTGVNLSDNWVIRSIINKVDAPTATANGSELQICVGSATNDGWFNTSDQLGISVRQDWSSGTNKYSSFAGDGQYTYQNASTANNATLSISTLYYIQIIKNKTAETLTAEIFTGSDYSTGSLGNASVSTTGKTYSGIRYLMLRDFADSVRSGTTYNLREISVYDGITSV